MFARRRHVPNRNAACIEADRRLGSLRGHNGVSKNGTEVVGELTAARDLKQAHQIQSGLVPSDVRTHGLDVAIAFEPYHSVGGDYADVVEMPDGRVLLVVADVVGKGVQGALVVAAMHSHLHALVASGHSLAALVGKLNEYLLTYLAEGPFVTMVLVAVDGATGETEAVSAGHPLPLVAGMDAFSRPLNCASTLPLGVAPFAPETHRDALREGELLAMFSDGVTESFSPFGHMFTSQRLGQRLTLQPESREARAVVDDIRARLYSFRGLTAATDDVTLLIVRRGADICKAA